MKSGRLVILFTSLAAAAAGCGGGAHETSASTSAASSTSSKAATVDWSWYRGDWNSMPSFGGGDAPAWSAAYAGFDWFETGYPGDSWKNEVLRGASVRPFAYINLSELDPGLAGQANYSGSILGWNGGWGLQLVDVTDWSWQDWLVRRADYAYQTGSRGIKWDARDPEIPWGKSRWDVNDAIASVMQRIRDQHPDLKFIFNQGFEFASAYPQYIDAMETEGLFSCKSYGPAWLQPWNDPWWWGPQYDHMKALQNRGAVIIVAEYLDPWSWEASQVYDAITGQGFVPYITNEGWNARGRGLYVNPGW